MTRPEGGRMQAGGMAFCKCLKSIKRPGGRKGRRVAARAWVRVFLFSMQRVSKLLYPRARNTLRPFRPSGLFLFFSKLSGAYPPAYPPACIRPSFFLCSTVNNPQMVRGEL